MGRDHPDFYSALHQLQKEQADTESQLAEFSLGKSVKAKPKKKWYDLQARLQKITLDYNLYKDQNQDMEYLLKIAANIYI